MEETYQTIPQKYRPKRFSEVVSQAAIVRTLQNALRKERVGPAYIFSGGRGSGKTTLARILAKALNCKNIKDQEPCNMCESCIGRTLDIIEIDGASNRGIDDIRALSENACYATAGSKYKIYIIDEVHMLTKEAFNALLKILEEPPVHVKFFFATTEINKVPLTILSRCQRFDLLRISEEETALTLEKITLELGVSYEKEALLAIARASSGSLRDAEALLEKLLCFCDEKLTLSDFEEMQTLVPRDYFFRLDKAIQESERAFAFEMGELIFRKGVDFSIFIESLTEHFRSHLRARLSKTTSLDPYLESAPKYTISSCTRFIETLVRAFGSLEKLPFKRLFVEAILLQLIENFHEIGVDELVYRLSLLEEKKPSLEKTELPPIEKIEPVVLKTPPLEKVELPPAKKELPPLEKIELPPLEKIELPPAKKELPPLEKIEPVVSKTPPLEKIEPLIVTEEESPSLPSSYYDTLMRFAAVELEGTLKS